MEEEDETKQEQQQVLSFLDHVLANESEAIEEEEILQETGEVHLVAEPPAQSISQKKKDSGYGSQGHLKHEVISQVTLFSEVSV